VFETKNVIVSQLFCVVYEAGSTSGYMSFAQLMHDALQRIWKWPFSDCSTILDFGWRDIENP
jgi:hypothetical protein